MEISVVYGTETGNSEAIAERITSDIQKLGFKSACYSMNNFVKTLEKIISEKEKRLIVAICSTTGNGDPPKGSEKFIRLIKSKSLATDSLSNLEFALLGLGDSNYSKFLFIPKLINENLLRLGAKAFIKRGDADDAYGLEEIVEPWISGLLKEISRRYEKDFAIKQSKQTESDIPVVNEFIDSQPDLKFINSHVVESNNNINAVESGVPGNEEHNKEEPNKTKEVFNPNNYKSYYALSTFKISKNERTSGPNATLEIYQVGLKSLNGEVMTDYSPGSHLSILPRLAKEKALIIENIIDICNEEELKTNNEKVDNINNGIDKRLFKLPLSFTEDYPYYQELYNKNSGYVSFDDLIAYLLDFSTVVKKLNFEKLIEKIKAIKDNLKAQFDNDHDNENYFNNQIEDNYRNPLNPTIKEPTDKIISEKPNDNGFIKGNSTALMNCLEVILGDLTWINDNFSKKAVSNKLSFYDIFLGIYELFNSQQITIDNNNNPIKTHNSQIYKLKFSLSEILEIIPFKKPRKYSISSSMEYDRQIEFSFSLVKQNYSRKLTVKSNSMNNTKNKDNNNNSKFRLLENNNFAVFLGETTNYLKSLKLGESVLVCEIKNSLPFPRDSHLKQSFPLIYISNGTGITPCLSYMKSIIREDFDKIGKFTLISGIRSNSGLTSEAIEENFINKFSGIVNYNDNSLMENNNSASQKEIFSYYSCISTGKENEGEECGVWRNVRINFDYVQDIINDKKSIIYQQLFEQNGCLIICGDLDKLYDEIISILISAVKLNKGIERSEALFLVENLKTSGKIQVEKWS